MSAVRYRFRQGFEIKADHHPLSAIYIHPSLNRLIRASQNHMQEPQGSRKRPPHHGRWEGLAAGNLNR